MSMTETSSNRHFPPWLRVSCRGGTTRSHVRRLLHHYDLYTVCESANCPNLAECWERGTATFMILGNACTRNCGFCAVPCTDNAPQPDPEEPDRLADAAKRLDLDYVVVTSVTRDDLADGGAGQFAATIRALRKKLPHAGVEVLTPDFRGDCRQVQLVLDEHPTVFNHNIETCRRLAPQVRPQADYQRSLKVLHYARSHGSIATGVKSGAMLGMGETSDEIHGMLKDLRIHGVQILTLGQYLPPSKDHWPLGRYVPPEEFSEWQRIAEQEYGFSHVVSGPLVRSSYHADKAADETGYWQKYKLSDLL